MSDILQLLRKMGKKCDKTSETKMKNLLIIGLCSLLIFLSSLLVNVIQLINYLTIRLISIDCYRQINCFLQYVIYSQLVAVAERWAKCTLTVYFGDEKTRQMFGKEHSLAVTNHRYEVDAIYLWMTCVKCNVLGSCKAFGKKSLRFVPIIGWNFFFGEYIFLERNWEKDAITIGTGLDRLMAHKQNVTLMIAAEGTRFTNAKYRTSMKFAEEKGIGVHYKHHLLPRYKGFAYCVKHLKTNYPNCALYNIQLAFDRESDISVSNLIKGIPMKGSIYIKRIPIVDVPTDNDEDIKNYLYDLYSEKDQLMEYHFQNSRFPGIEVPQKPHLLPLLVLWTNFLIVGLPLVYLLWRVFTSGNTVLISVVSLLIIIVYVLIYFAIRSAKIAKASTYGTLEGNSSSDKKSLVNGNNNRENVKKEN